jgi:hypothetical protein
MKLTFSSVTIPCFSGFREIQKGEVDIMRRNVLASAALASAVSVVLSAHANADNEKFSAKFSGFEEVGPLPRVTSAPGAEPETFSFPTGAIFSPGTGTLQLSLDKNLLTITYTLTYTPMSSAVTQAHIHFGKIHVPGGIMVFFCTNQGNGPPTTPPTPLCPTPTGTPPSATVTGTWTAANVVAVPGQNITVNNFSALIAALESDTAYGNIHTMNFPSGEIRGQIRKSEDDNKD